MQDQKIKIEIWSDIACPFCFIGQTHLNQALRELNKPEAFDIQYKSYQLSPDLVTDTTINSYQSLAKHKGISVDEAKQMSEHVEDMGSKSGVVFHFDKTIPANTLKAHKLLHFAKSHDKQSEVKKALFLSHFVNGENIDDTTVLEKIAAENQLPTEALKDVFENAEYSKKVEDDVTEARSLGVRGVPFFVIDRKYGVSGAQPIDHFKQVLAKSLEELAQN